MRLLCIAAPRPWPLDPRGAQSLFPTFPPSHPLPPLAQGGASFWDTLRLLPCLRSLSTRQCDMQGVDLQASVLVIASLRHLEFNAYHVGGAGGPPRFHHCNATILQRHCSTVPLHRSTIVLQCRCTGYSCGPAFLGGRRGCGRESGRGLAGLAGLGGMGALLKGGRQRRSPSLSVHLFLPNRQELFWSRLLSKGGGESQESGSPRSAPLALAPPQLNLPDLPPGWLPELSSLAFEECSMDSLPPGWCRLPALHTLRLKASEAGGPGRGLERLALVLRPSMQQEGSAGWNRSRPTWED